MATSVKVSKLRNFNPFQVFQQGSAYLTNVPAVPNLEIQLILKSMFENLIQPKIRVGKCWEQLCRQKRWSKKVENFDELSERLTFDPSIESSHRGKKDSIICLYSKNDPIARYRGVKFEIVFFESSISPSSSKTRHFHGHILSSRPLIYQSQLKLRTNTTILNKKFRSVKASNSLADS